jgi:hypothetical protein
MTFKKNAQRQIVFVMIDSADTKNVKTGLTVTAQASKDGGAFANATNAVAEIGGGFYKLTLTADEMNADAVALKLTATGAVQQNLVFYTVTKLASDLNDPSASAIRTELEADGGKLDAICDKLPSGSLSGFNPASQDVNLSDTDLADLKDSIKGTPNGRTVKEAYEKADAAKGVADKLNTAMEADGAVYRFTQNALEQAPLGQGNWTTDEKAQIRQALGLSGTTGQTTGDGNLDDVLARLTALLGHPVVVQTSVAAVGQEIVRYRGDTAPMAFDAGRDLTGAALRFTVKRRATDPQSAALITKSSQQASEIEITDAAEGRFLVKLAADDTTGLLPNGRRAAFLYDVEMTLSSQVETLFAGALILLPDVTTP